MAMAAKRSLNARNLEALGAAALAQLLIELSSGNALIQRRLRLALAASAGAEAAAQEVRKRLAAIARSGSGLDAGRRKLLLAELEAQQQTISGLIASADPALALELQLRLLELSEGVLERCETCFDELIELFQRGVTVLVNLATSASIGPELLVESVAELLQAAHYGQFDTLIPALAPRLGEAGLRQLEEALLDNGGLSHHSRWQLALGRGDLDAYLTLFSPERLRWPDTAAEVADQLLRGGRAEQALAVLEHAREATEYQAAEAWHAIRFAALEALGRHEQAQQERWQVFCDSLSVPLLRDYLSRLDDFADLELEQRAFAVAEAHAEPLAALEFLILWPSLARAARYVIDNWQQWDGDNFEIYVPAAERLSADHPLAATLLLRSMVIFALAMGRSNRYRYAVQHLRQCEQLEARIDAWQGFESHTSFVGRLRQEFGTKWSFWQQLER